MSILNIARILVINADQKGLVLRRDSGDDYRPGEIDLPGGEIERGEAPIAAIKRELLEETGIELRADPTLVYTGTDSRDGRSINRLLFVTAVEEVEVVISHEHEAFWWDSIDTIADAYGDRLYGEGIRYAQARDLLHFA